MRRAEILARNESLWREANETVAHAAARFDIGAPDGHLYEFFCECDRLSCGERLRLSMQEYEQVRAEPTHFLVKADHVDVTVERVVAANPRFSTVEKIGEAGAVAASRNPR